MDKKIEALSVSFYAFSINDRTYGFQLIQKLCQAHIEKNEFVENSDKYFNYLKRSNNLLIEDHFRNVLKNNILPLPYYIWLKEYDLNLFLKLNLIRKEFMFHKK